MMNFETIETPSEHVRTVSSEDNLENLSVLKFYSPICVSGYLTPLQRKKLREKRNDMSVDSNDSNLRKVTKTRIRKRKKTSDSVLREKNKDQVKRIRTKDSIQQVQCTVSKIVHKTTDDSTKPKKFFKSSASERLDKANFIMPLYLKKNVFLNIDRCVKETLAHTRKLTQHKENNACHLSSSEVFDCTEDLELKNNALLRSKKENMLENNRSYPQIRKNSEVFKQPQDNSLEQISLPEKLILEFNWPSDEELLIREKKAREFVRKKSILREANNHEPTRGKNENKEQNFDGSEMKLYPIFHIAMKKQSRINEIKRNLKNVNKKIKTSNDSEQMIIDAGQKEIGAKICSTCNMLYTIGHEEDERLHLNYHNMHVINLKFPGWKEENVVNEYSDGRVIMIRKSDKSFMLKKVEDVLQVANRDLGFSSSGMPAKPDLTFLLFISNDKVVVGCIVAEPISKAFQVLLAGNGSTPVNAPEEKVERVDNWCSSSKAVPAICGVNRIWVAHNFRRQKVASRLVDCLRCHFIHGHVIGIREIAFTDPSPDGRQFAATYTGTANFLVYK